MKPYAKNERAVIFHGDCREVMAQLPENSIDAVVTDPPYELGFMNREWDGTGIAFDPEMWKVVLRVAKPGAHLLSFGAPRTFPEMAVAIRQAGWERRDTVMWMFGQGFPKSFNLDEEWNGWGTNLKPGYEPIVLARKPLAGTVARNVLEHGTGALNIDATRIGLRDERPLNRNGSIGYGGSEPQGAVVDGGNGRWPANVVLDEEAAGLVDEASGERDGGGPARGVAYPGQAGGIGGSGIYGGTTTTHVVRGYNDTGGASRFYYTAKASRAEREALLDGLELVRRSDGRAKDIENPRLRTNARKNHHPTVKPVDLMRWLVRLVTPPGGVVLDPFFGSGSTGVATAAERMRIIGIELEEKYCEIAKHRLGFELPLLKFLESIEDDLTTE